MNRIAILDFHEQDPGLKILFPEAEYYVFMKGYDRSKIYSQHNINAKHHNEQLNVFEEINDKNYDDLMIVFNIYNSIREYNGIVKSDFFFDINLKFLDKIMLLILKNNFKNVFIFDNYDYNYDPNIISSVSEVYNHIIKTKNILFFKRNFNNKIHYQQNVFPFPYIMFGKFCNINTIISAPLICNEIIPLIFFSGTLFEHKDSVFGIFRNRKNTMEKINTLINVDFYSNLPHDVFMTAMSKYKYSLDLLGIGDPNIRTFEILWSNSLRLAERSNLKWNFDDDFCEETYFSDEHELFNKLLLLENNNDLYNKCLQKQKYIVSTYMNVSALRNYIEEKMK
jgi:hypothetical protein